MDGLTIRGTASDGRKVVAVVADGGGYPEVTVGDQTITTQDPYLPRATRMRLISAVRVVEIAYKYELSRRLAILNMWTNRGLVWLLLTQWLCLYSVLLSCISSLTPFVIIAIMMRRHTYYDEKYHTDKIVAAFDDLYVYVIRNRNKANKKKERKEHLKYYTDKLSNFGTDHDSDEE